MYKAAFEVEELCREIRRQRGDRYAAVKSEMAKAMGIGPSAFSKRLKQPNNFRLEEIARFKTFLESNGIDGNIDAIFLQKISANENIVTGETTLKYKIIENQTHKSCLESKGSATNHRMYE